MNKVQFEILQALRRTHPGVRYEGEVVGLDGRPYRVWSHRTRYGSVVVRIYDDGTIVVLSDWGSETHYDKWEIDPQGAVRYRGTVDGIRYAPDWLLGVPGLIWAREGGGHA